MYHAAHDPVVSLRELAPRKNLVVLTRSKLAGLLCTIAVNPDNADVRVVLVPTAILSKLRFDLLLFNSSHVISSATRPRRLLFLPESPEWIAIARKYSSLMDAARLDVWRMIAGGEYRFATDHTLAALVARETPETVRALADLLVHVDACRTALEERVSLVMT